MHFGTKILVLNSRKLALCRFIYGVMKTFLCSERVVHVHYVAIDDLVISTPLKKRYNRPLVMLW